MPAPADVSEANADGSQVQPPRLQDVVAGLENLEFDSAAQALQFDDDTVRAALASAVRVAPHILLANFAKVLGHVGGPQALDSLRARRVELAASPAMFQDAPIDSSQAIALECIVTAELLLSNDVPAAAEVLVRLMAHPSPPIRIRAASSATALLLQNRASRTAAMNKLRATLIAWEPADAQEYAAALPWLYTVRPSGTIERARQLLASTNRDDRQAIVRALARCDQRSEVVAELCDYVESETSLRLALDVCRFVHHFVPLERKVSLVRAALDDDSPSLRLAALEFLPWLPQAIRSNLASVALSTEPDPILLGKLKDLFG